MEKGPESPLSVILISLFCVSAITDEREFGH